MNHVLASFCDWLQNTPVGLWVGRTLYGYPFVQMIHFFGLSLWVGTIVMLDLRLIGLAGTKQQLSEFSDHLFPWTWTGLCLVAIGGLLLFSSAAETYFYNPAFRVKIPLVLIGITFHIAILRNVRKWSLSEGTPRVAKIAGIAELALWVAVISAAVSIPNY